MRCVDAAAMVAAAATVGIAGSQPVEWLNAIDGDWGDSANWVGGVVPNLAALEPTLGLVGGYTVASSAGRSHGLLRISNPEARLEILGTTHFISGNVVNDGSILLSESDLEFRNGDRRIDGSGTITLGAVSIPSFSQIVADGVSVTHAAGHTINGNGTITATGAGGAWRNRGNINADDPSGPGIELLGTLEQAGNGRIGADGGVLTLRNGAGIVGGELVVANGGSLDVLGSAAVSLEEVRIIGRIEIAQADYVLALDGSIELQGEIALNATNSGNEATLRFDADATISGSGDVILQLDGGSAGAVRVASGVTGTIGPGITVRGSGFISGVGGGIVNEGAIIANDPTAELILEGAHSGPGLYGANNATMTLGSFARLAGCTLNTLGSGVVLVSENIVVLTGGGNEGVVELLRGAELRLAGAVYTNNGTITQPATDFSTELVLLQDGVRVLGDGSFVFNSSMSGIESSSGQPATIGPTQTIFGRCTLDGELVIEGVLEPEGTVMVEGDVELMPGARVRMQIDEVGQPGADRVIVAFGTGALTLGGTLVVEAEPGFVPEVGDSWLLIVGEPDVLFDSFDGVELPVPPPGAVYGMETTSQGVRVELEAGCAADLNGDGAADFFDVQAYLVLFAAGDLAADLTGDGLLDFFDVQAFLSVFAGGCA